MTWATRVIVAAALLLVHLLLHGQVGHWCAGQELQQAALAAAGLGHATAIAKGALVWVCAVPPEDVAWSSSIMAASAATAHALAYQRPAADIRSY